MEEEKKPTTEQLQSTSTDVQQQGVGTSTDGNSANPLQETAQSLSTKPLRATDYGDAHVAKPMIHQPLQETAKSLKTAKGIDTWFLPKEQNVQSAASTVATKQSAPFSGLDEVTKVLKDEYERRKAQEETPEQRAKREKREKANRKIAAISDGVRALSNLFFTTQYAPNMYNHEKDSGYKALDERLQQAQKEREANHEAYISAATKYSDALQKQAKTRQEAKQAAENAKIAAEKEQRAAAAEKRDAELHPYKVQEAAAKAATANSKSATAAAEAENAPDYYKERTNTQRERTNTEKTRQAVNRSTQTRNYASARASNRSNQGEHYVWQGTGKNKKIVGRFKDRSAAEEYADIHGEEGFYVADERQDIQTTTVTSKDTKGRQSSKETTVVKGQGGSSNNAPYLDDKTAPHMRHNR